MDVCCTGRRREVNGWRTTMVGAGDGARSHHGACRPAPGRHAPPPADRFGDRAQHLPSRARRRYRLYLLIHGDAGDPKKRVLLEKSIAMALHNTGNLRESIEHFDRALSHLGDVGDRDGAAAALSQAEALLRRLGRSNVAPYPPSTYRVRQ